MSNEPRYFVVKLNRMDPPVIREATGDAIISTPRGWQGFRPGSEFVVVETDFVTREDLAGYISARVKNQRNALGVTGKIWRFMAWRARLYGIPYIVLCGDCDKLFGECRCYRHGRQVKGEWRYNNDHNHWMIGKKLIIECMALFNPQDIPHFGPTYESYIRGWVGQL